MIAPVDLGKPGQKKERTREERKPRADTHNAVRASYKAAMPAQEEREPTPEEVDLFERLKAWRRVVANRLNLPPYIIFHDKTLHEIARVMPRSIGQLHAISGIGTTKLERYGAALLDIVRSGPVEKVSIPFPPHFG